MKKTIFFIFIFILPSVYSATYGFGDYGCGEYGIGCDIVEDEEPVAGAGIAGTLGARGGGCDALADEHETCYHIEPDTLMCIPGCEEGHRCNEDFRCELGDKMTKTQVLLETVKSPKVLIIIIVAITSILIGIKIEEEIIKNKNKKGEKDGEYQNKE